MALNGVLMMKQKLLIWKILQTLGDCKTHLNCNRSVLYSYIQYKLLIVFCNPVILVTKGQICHQYRKIVIIIFRL